MNKRKTLKSGLPAATSAVAEAPPPTRVGQLDLEIGQNIEQSRLSVSYDAAESLPESMACDVAESKDAVATEIEPAFNAASEESFETPVAMPSVSIVAAEEVRQSLGERFRGLRETRGISREEMARRLRVSPTVVQDIESDQWDRLGAPVYVRGHLNSYAKVLEVPAVVVSMALRDLNEPAPLALTVAAPVPSSWWSRYSSAATYVVLTLLLAIPIFTIVDYRGFNSPVAPTQQVRSLEDDEAGPEINGNTPLLLLPSSDAASDFVGPPESAAGAQPQPWTAPVASNSPLMASMTPIGSSASPEETLPGMHRIEMVISQDTWLEIVDVSGTRLDYGIARAGERRAHQVNGAVAMSIGNVNGVDLVVDGKSVDLAPFARLNVARLKLFEPEPTSATPSR
jgi:cytoskeleton protein RodZ